MNNLSNLTSKLSGGNHAHTNTSSNNSGGGDMIDKLINSVENKAGHPQSHSTTEKISDAVRTGVQKVTGKNVPIRDKQF